MLQDIRFAFRSLKQHRFVSAMVVLCLGLVVGANTMVFGIIRNYLLKPLPFQDVERLALVWETVREVPKNLASLTRTMPRSGHRLTTYLSLAGVLSPFKIKYCRRVRESNPAFCDAQRVVNRCPGPPRYSPPNFGHYYPPECTNEGLKSSLNLVMEVRVKTSFSG